jgi:hypothetical protein
MNWKRSLKVLALGLALTLPSLAAYAQQVNVYWNTGGCTSFSCWGPVSAANPLPVTGSFSLSIAGFPGTTQTTGTPISVTTGGVTGTLPVGTVVVASNVGATNGAYCKLGASASTSDQLIPPNSWFGFTVGANTQLTCITSTSTTTVNMVGGSGLPTGSGGGGGGSGSSGAVFGPTAVGSANANPPVVIGGTVTGAAGQNVEGVAVKPASTAALATDFSLVTNESPNSQLSVAIGTSADTPCTLPATTTTCSLIAVQKAAANNIIAAVPVSVNGTATALTGLTPGSAQTGTIIAANQDVTSWHGTALGAPSAYGTSPGTVTVPGVNAFVTNSPTTNGASNVTATDCSGTVATGGTAVNAFTAQTTLHGFTIFNTNTAEVMWISFTTTAAASTAGSYPIPAATATTFAGGGSFTSPPGFGLNHALSVVAATSAHSFSCTWW